MIRRLALCVLAVAACDEAKDSSARAESARAPSVEPAANLELPVELPTLDAKLVRPVGTAPTFAAIRAGGDASIGTLAPGLRAQKGSRAPLAGVGAALEKLLGGTAAAPPAATLHGRISDDDHADVVALLDGQLGATTLLDVFGQLPQRTIAIAVRADRPARLPFVLAPLAAGAPQAAPIHIGLRRDGLEIYGATVAWGDAQPELEQLLKAKRAASSMTLLADLAIAPDLPLQQLVDVLGLLPGLGVAELQLSRAETTATDPVPPPAGGNTGWIPQVSIGQPTVVGDLDKAIIRRYIKRNIQKITYCYEKRMLVKPGISGTTIARFTILPAGTVRGSTATGFDREVTDCLANVISGIEFPKPKGGGSVQVTYPFTFRPSGS